MQAQLRIDEVKGDDGFNDRRTRGINPTRHSWQLRFPFRNAAEHQAMDAFLLANCRAGFWFTPPFSTKAVLATCDEWTATIIDRTGGGDLLGELQATFVRSFTPQENA